MTVLIPSYRPDERLITLIRQIQGETDYDIVIVNDGSAPEQKQYFDKARELGCIVLEHAENMGKGAALKTGFTYVFDHTDSDLVTADADGQHLVKDIIRVAGELKGKKNTLVVGGRRFTGDVPVRSRLGNGFTRFAFLLASGKWLYDTQTGLRGIPHDHLQWMIGLSGDRFEYEMNMLLKAPQHGLVFDEIPIETVYLDENKSSHFRTVFDALRVFLPILTFALSSIIAAIIDFFLVLFLTWLNSGTLQNWIMITARCISATVNYIINRKAVFRSSGSRFSALAKYILLAAVILVVNMQIMNFLHLNLGVSLGLSKIITEAILYVFSYVAQRFFVFSHGRTQTKA